MIDNHEKFNKYISIIDQEIQKRKSKWTLNSINWMDFDDVSQILRLHIFRKMHMYDESQPLLPWLNTVISHQLRNLIRNTYTNFARPCLRCSAAEGEDLCSIYGKQCDLCPIYKKWSKSKQNAYHVKLPVSFENHQQEIFDMINDHCDIDRAAGELHGIMKKYLTNIEWKIYNLLFVLHKTDEEAANIMGYKTTEYGRKAGYKQIINLKKSIIRKARKVVYAGEIDTI